MDSYIVVIGNGRSVKVTAENDGTVSETTLRGAFLLENDKPIGLYRDTIALTRCRRQENDYFFKLNAEWAGAEFELCWEKARSSPTSSTSHPKPGSKRKRVDHEQPVEIENLSESQTEYVSKLKKFIYYSILMKTDSGAFENVNAIRSCVTVARKECAITAAHCLPDGLPEGFQFEIFDQDDKSVLVQVEYINQANDFAVLKTVTKPFENYPQGLAYPDAGIPYTLLGYHGYNYQPTTFLSAFFGHIRNNRHFHNLEYVLGSPGTTRGCSGSGVFEGLALIGIVVSGRIPPRNMYSRHMSLADHVGEACTELAEPSYNHIVPCTRIFDNFESHQLYRSCSSLSSPQAQ
ncbi:unnamed protein product [Auanema sp. JU1783]|nr:unnamed protein product [Auanema sp. JU1783]